MTNGDRIRQMTDKQIAEMITFENSCMMCAKTECREMQSPDYCCHNIEKWLKMESVYDDE